MQQWMVVVVVFFFLFGIHKILEFGESVQHVSHEGVWGKVADLAGAAGVGSLATRK